MDFDDYIKDSNSNSGFLTYIDPLILIFSLALSGAMTVAIGFLCFIQTRFLLFNSTTIESRKFETYEESPYYYKEKCFNFKNVIGDNFKEWIIPTFKKNIYNNGFYFVNPKNQMNMDNFSSVKNELKLEDVLNTKGNNEKESNEITGGINNDKLINKKNKYLNLNEDKSLQDITMRVREDS